MRAFGEDQLPATARTHGIDLLTVSYAPDTFDDGHVIAERVDIDMHHGVGYTRSIRLSHENGSVRPVLFVDTDEEPSPIETPLTVAEQSEIVDALLNGETFWLELDTPAGEFARRVDMVFGSAPQVEESDRQLLQNIIDELAPQEP